MKQVLQDLRSGEIAIHDVPEPGPQHGYVLVGVERSLISAGTERAVAALGAKSLVQKARARPDLVRRTIEVARAEGIGTAATKVRSRLDRHTAFGYSLAGRVLDTGGDPRLAEGMLVACVGAGHAIHAEVVSVPATLVVPVPEGVSADDAAFAAPAAIALHAIRLADAGPGATVAVIGLGLIGQLAGRLLRASGCLAVGTDPREDRCALFGEQAATTAHDLVARVSRGRGADAVLVCAATPSSEPVALATELARDRGAVVVVGDVGLELERRTLYEKELSLVVARSYGPGRYDRAYEERGQDYPVGYVRWTEGRNVEAVLDLVASSALAPAGLVTHRFPIAAGDQAFSALDEATALGVLLEYDRSDERRRTIELSASRPAAGALRVGLIGAGSFARGTLVPSLQAAGNVEIVAVGARSGSGAASLAGRIGAATATTDADELIRSDDVDAVVIATPHAEHAELAAAALSAGKAVWVEKPLAITHEGLEQVAASASGGGLLLVGHNRRFAPLSRRLREAVTGPVVISLRIAAGPLEPGHWLEDPAQGGRVLGEISHFVDLATFFAGAPPARVWAALVPGPGGESLAGTIRFENGSAATLAYGVGRADGLAKERIEVLGAGGGGVIDDFRTLELFGAEKGTSKSRRDKGHAAAVAAFVAAARGEAGPPVPVDEQLLVAAASLALLDAARTGEPVDVRLPG